jgi:hypothetical protein
MSVIIIIFSLSNMLESLCIMSPWAAYVYGRMGPYVCMCVGEGGQSLAYKCALLFIDPIEQSFSLPNMVSASFLKP